MPNKRLSLLRGPLLTPVQSIEFGATLRYQSLYNTHCLTLLFVPAQIGSAATRPLLGAQLWALGDATASCCGNKQLAESAYTHWHTWGGGREGGTRQTGKKRPTGVKWGEIWRNFTPRPDLGLQCSVLPLSLSLSLSSEVLSPLRDCGPVNCFARWCTSLLVQRELATRPCHALGQCLWMSVSLCLQASPFAFRWL